MLEVVYIKSSTAESLAGGSKRDTTETHTRALSSGDDVQSKRTHASAVTSLQISPAVRRSTACRATDYRSKPAGDISVAVFGSTGYIGRKVTDEMISRGFKVRFASKCSSMQWLHRLMASVGGARLHGGTTIE